MSWDYRIIDHGTHLGLHEVHYDGEGKPRSYTTEAVSFVCDPEDGVKGITASLERALNCALYRDVLKPADFRHTSADAMASSPDATAQSDGAGEPPLPDQQLANGGACS